MASTVSPLRAVKDALAPGTVPDDDRTTEVLARLTAVRDRIAARLGAADAAANGPLAGLFLSHDRAVALADGATPIAPVGVRPLPATGPLAALAARVGLDTVDVELLVIAAAPDLDGRVEKLYGYLHDDLTRRRASVGLALDLAGLSSLDPTARARLSEGGPLVRHGLLAVGPTEEPFPSRPLTVPDRVVAWLLGDDRCERALAERGVKPVPLPDADVDAIADARRRSPFVHLLDGIGGAGVHLAAEAVRRAGQHPFAVDIGPATDADSFVVAVARHVALTGDVAIVRGVDGAADRAPAAVGRLTELPSAVLVTTAPWNPTWTPTLPGSLTIDELGRGPLGALWHDALRDAPVADGAVDAVVAGFRLTPEQVRGAAVSARRALDAEHPVLDFADLSRGARAWSASGLDRLARRLEPSAAWDDLVLPPDVHRLLRELMLRVRHRDRVMHDWQLARGWRGRGTTALFAGPSGTGKTTAAEVIARELGYDIHVVDLSSVVDKYIGETEKKLEVIFTEAERTNTVLLFDEADAIFGKRSEVKDARDRYANVEVSYLLQRMERFAGLAVLTTNLGANLDEAFTRRLDVVVEFPRPDVDARRRLWAHELRATLPQHDIDLDYCAGSFEVTGGEIRNIVVTAAYLAAEHDRAVTMTDVVGAVQREYRKMGRLCLPGEFGRFAGLLEPVPTRRT